MVSSLYVLFVDSYDSFTYNVVNLISNCLPGFNIQVTTIHNDSVSNLSKELLESFHCIIVGPGPGNPKDKESIGILYDIFRDDNEPVLSGLLDGIPILGICLGWQAMCYYQDWGNAHIEQLDNIKHGQVYDMELMNQSDSKLFQDCPTTFQSVRYHSLHVELPGFKESHGASLKSSKVIPLVKCQDEDDGVLLMGGQIRGKPWYGVQYHPESCCSELGELLIQNFIKNVVLPEMDDGVEKTNSNKDTVQFAAMRSSLRNKIDKTPILDNYRINKDVFPQDKDQCRLAFKVFNFEKISEKLDIASIVLNLGEIIGPSNFILLSSLMKQKNRGEFTVFGVPYDQKSKVYTYNAFHKNITTKKWNSDLYESVDSQREKSDFWKFIEIQMMLKRAKISDSLQGADLPDVLKSLPFIGGFLGILNYEMGDCVPLLGASDLSPDVPDCVFVEVEQTIVWDHFEERFYFIYNELSSDAGAFIDLMNTIVNALESCVTPKESSQHEMIKYHESMIDFQDCKYTVDKPQTDEYYQAFDKCQEYLHCGDSYELCLTTQCNVVSKGETGLNSWSLFKKLSLKNPAPFSSFFDIPNCNICLCSSSPERFLKWDTDLKDCELRPIKGTVKKTADMTVEKATKILKTRKEFGENLMIVDLIRNDLYEMLPKVTMKELMSVEEYETVYQLVSVISGSSSPEDNSNVGNISPQPLKYTGLDILKHSLPPGSMTGAPKKSSVEILQKTIENNLNTTRDGKRNCYSGVTGYYSLNGRGDWSVNIRCIFTNDYTNWKLGAGGAITVLSTKESEWDEMLVKLESTLQIFQD